MISEQRDCEAILTQLLAARAALDRVSLLVAENFAQECAASPQGEMTPQRLSRVLEMVLSRFSVPYVDIAPENQVEPSKES